MPQWRLRPDCGADGQQIAFVYFAGSSAFYAMTSSFWYLFETIELDGMRRLDPCEEGPISASLTGGEAYL